MFKEFSLFTIILTIYLTGVSARGFKVGYYIPSARSRLHTYPSYPFWDFVCLWILSDLREDLVCAVKSTVNSCVQLPCCVQKTLFCCSHLPLTLTLFLPTLQQWSLSLGRHGYNRNVPFRCGLFFSAPWPVVGLCVSNRRLAKKLLWRCLRVVLIYGYNSKSLFRLNPYWTPKATIKSQWKKRLSLLELLTSEVP